MYSGATKESVRATRSVCTPPVAHTVVATMWVRTSFTTKEFVAVDHQPAVVDRTNSKTYKRHDAVQVHLDLSHQEKFSGMNLLFVRDKKSLYTNSRSTKLFPHLRLSLRTFPGLYSYFRIWRRSVNGSRWTFLLCAFLV